jgi:hypothetical protein
VHHLVTKDLNQYVAYRVMGQQLTYQEAEERKPYLVKQSDPDLNGFEEALTSFNEVSTELGRYSSQKKAQLACVKDTAWLKAKTIEVEDRVRKGWA